MILICIFPIDELCFSLFQIIPVINLLFNDVIYIYFLLSFYSFSFIANRVCRRQGGSGKESAPEMADMAR